MPTPRIDFTAMAMEIAKREDGPRQVDITQIRSVLHHALVILGEHSELRGGGYVWDSLLEYWARHGLTAKEE